MLIKILIFGALFFFLLSFLGFKAAIRPPKILSDITPEDFGVEYEEVWFETEDNVKLNGWFVPNENPDAGTAMVLHGYPADKGDVFWTAKNHLENFNLFLFDFRYFGKSEGRHSTIGVKEVNDLRAAVNYLVSRGENEIVVWGFSMGGAVAIMGSSDLSEIKAVVSDSSYASLSLLAPDIYRLPILRHPLGWLTEFWAKLFLGIDTRENSPMKQAKEIELPIFIIHSKQDSVIPFSHALLLQESLKENSLAEFWFREGFSHGQVGGEEYRDRINDFFSRSL